MNSRIALAAGMAMAALVSGAATISDVVIRQQWPWSPKVNIDFLLEGELDEDCDVKLEISDAKGPLNVYANSFAGELSNIRPGAHHIVWDPTLSGVTSAEAIAALKFKLTASAALGGKYMVIDISSGAEGTDYPITYLSSEPTGGFNTDEYKLNKMALRRIPAGMFVMGSPEDEPGHLEVMDGNGYTSEKQVPVLLTNDFYIGVFPVTFHQLTNVCVSLAPGFATRSSWYKDYPKRPSAYVSYNDLFGSTCQMPKLLNAEEGSFFGLLRQKTASQSLPSGWHFSLPSEAQWEYACRAGTTTAWNNGTDCVLIPEKNNQDLNADKLGLTGNYGGSAAYGGSNGLNKDVGCFQPNAWGLYDMNGTISEYICHATSNTYRFNVDLLIEPVTSGNTYVQTKGGGVSYPTVHSRSACGKQSGRGQREMSTGFRLALVRKPAE